MLICVDKAMSQRNQNKCGCQQQYDPVCSTKNLTYPNLCYLKCDGVQIKHQGSCSSCNCPQLYEPVCGNNNRTYNNQCLMECEGVGRKSGGECASGDRMSYYS